MTVQDTTTSSSSLSSLDRLILMDFPYPIASAYRQLLGEQSFERRVRRAIYVFEYSLRIFSICVISQYLLRDAETLSDVKLNELLEKRLPRASLGGWAEILFTTLQAYHDQRELFFIKELYDLYWDTSKTPHQPRLDVRRSYNRLIEIRNNLVHRLPPQDEGGWRELDEDVMQNLREILSQFVFIQNYYLLHVLERRGAEYACLTFRGEQISLGNVSLEFEGDIRLNTFYLVRKDLKSLSLHPLLIPWEGQPTAGDAAVAAVDAAIYESFTKTSLTYIATVLGKVVNVKEPTLLDEFVHLLYETVRIIKQGRLLPGHLTWHLLQEVSRLVSAKNFSHVRTRYHPNLYMQPRDAKQAYEAFLTSDKTAFVLLGRSGVGKSAFLQSVADEHEAGNQICALLFDAAKIDPDTPLLTTIQRDLQAYLLWEGEKAEAGVPDFLQEIARIEGIDQHRVVLFLDAVNENQTPKRLLQQIDALVGLSPYPWFKVVLSSRPEAWRAMTRGVQLHENRYYIPTGEVLGTELTFSHSGFEIKAFKREELPLVYEKYRQFYDLQTSFEQLSVEQRQLIRDPLTLKLIADIYRGQAISAVLNPGMILEQLLQSGRLEVADMQFLQEDILPLMMTGELFNAVITAQQVNTTITRAGRPLFELVQVDEVLSTGRRINQSFTNLVDAEILALLGSPMDYVIGFKYERFYDYFAGRHLYQISQTRPDRFAFYQAMIERAAVKPFLHNGVKSSIATRAREGENELIQELCFTPLRSVKKMMMEVLTDLGRENLDRCEEILQLLLPYENKPGILERVQRFFQKSAPLTDIRSRNAKKIAVQVARNLNAPWVLFYGLSGRGPILNDHTRHRFSG